MKKINKIATDKFINLSEPLYAYLLGLIWADGHISKKCNGVFFTSTFPDAIYFRKNFFRSGKWHVSIHTPKHKTWKKRILIYTSDKQLHDFLCSVDYAAKNNSADKILKHIPKSLQPYWILGLMDGDGHVTADFKNGLYEIQIAGPVDQNWEFLENYCRGINCEYTIQKTKNKKGRGSIFRIVGRRNVYAFGETIWNQTEFGLPRKREKYNIIKEKYLSLSSKFTGVSYSKKLKKFKAYTPLLSNKKRLHLGYFITQEEAAQARRVFIADNFPLVSRSPQ